MRAVNGITIANDFRYVTKSTIKMSSGDATLQPRRGLDQLVAHAQELSDRLLTGDRDEADATLKEFTSCIPRPLASVDRLVLRSILLDVAFKSGRAIHAQLHPSGKAQCTFSPATLLEEFWIAPNEEPSDQFERWRVAFFSELNRTHPPSLASSIGRLVKRDVGTSWSLKHLGKRFHSTPSQISRAFRREFGVAVSDYQRLARVSASMEAVRKDKLLAVALSVGFRSPKNFYLAFVRLIGLTPRAFKALPDDQATELRMRTKRRLLRSR